MVNISQRLHLVIVGVLIVYVIIVFMIGHLEEDSIVTNITILPSSADMGYRKHGFPLNKGFFV